MIVRRFRSVFASAAALTGLLAAPAPWLAALAQSGDEATPEGVATAQRGEDGAMDGLALPRPALDALGESPIAAVLQSLDDQTRRYHDHITTLANPFFEGRAPGLRGNTLAAEYIAFYFEQFGLQPAFATQEQTSDGVDVRTPASAYFQPFSTGSTRELVSARLSVSGLGELAHGSDFAALGFSGDAAVEEAPLVFVGYALDDARDGYTSFEDDTDLTGKVALVLRFEPMDEDGQSLWLRGGWSPNAAIEGKFRQCARRGAAGIILVNPPGADDERMGRLESVRSLAPTFGRPLDIPVVQMSEAMADRLVRRADSGARSLLDLRRLADAGTAVVDLPEETVSIAVDLEREETMTQNVGGLLPGRGDLAEQIIVIGAHYDHVGYGYDGGSRAGAAGMGVLHPGADDNGSGTSGLLLAAEALSRAYAELPQDASARSILFLAFSGEELGLLGSAHYVQNPPLPIDRHVFMLNMDMIGRLREGVMELGGVRTAPGLWEHLEPMVERSGLDVRPLPSGVGPSDHTNFYNAGMPVLFFHTLLHDEYHMPSDFSWTINHVGAVRVANLCVDVALDLAMREERFSRTTATRRERPYVGITGEDYPGGGVLVISVGEDTPAARAGLRENDVIIRWDGTEVEDQGQWRPLLQERSPGDEVTITVRRGDEEIELTCTLGRRGG
jgi:hypothetical protein